MPAVIQSTLRATPGGPDLPGTTQLNSRNDLRMGYQVKLYSFQAATTYSWTIAFASDSPGSVGGGAPFDGTSSLTALLPPFGSTSRDALFNVDYEGTYLIRLIVDAGLPTEDTQFIRCRVLTTFGALKLVSAGERRDQNGVIPVDASPEGWANDQNVNLQRIAIFLRRLSTTGRVLYVDSNRGRNYTNDVNDYDNIIALPGTDSARLEETGIKTRAMMHGDFASINEAITYAGDAVARGEAALSKDDPYFIHIRAGYYEEDLNLASFIHLIGELEATDTPNGPQSRAVTIRSVNAGGTGTHTYNPGAAAADEECFLYNLHLDNTSVTSNPTLFHTSGFLALINCTVIQAGDDVAQGPAVAVSSNNPATAPTLYVINSRIATLATPADRSALIFDASAGMLYLDHTIVDAGSCIGLYANPTLYTLSTLTVQNGSTLSGVTPFLGYPSYIRVERSSILAVAPNFAMQVVAPGPKAGNVVVDLDSCRLSGQIKFDTVPAVGTTALYQSAITHVNVDAAANPAVVLTAAPGDLPDTMRSFLRSDTLWYVKGYEDPRAPGAPTVPVANQVDEEDVQRIIDLLWRGTFPVTGSPFYSLESAYNGVATISPFTPGVGLGRNIQAVGGAVQIEGAVWPTGMESQLKHGGLQIEGVIDIGSFINSVGPTDPLVSVGGSEIHLNPDLAGSGPFIGLGKAAWATGITQPDRGFMAGSIVAGGAKLASENEPYHLHLRTVDMLTPNTSKAGNVYMVAGGVGYSSVDKAGDVHIVGGSCAGAAGTLGNIWLVPGNAAGPTTGAVYFVGAPAGGARANLLPVNNYAGGVAGTIYFATPVGVETLTLTGAENLAAAAASINAQARSLVASVSGGKLRLSSEYGPAGDLLYLGDSVAGALNTALGDYILGAGAVFTPGVYGDMVSVDVPSDGRLRVNGDLEVTGTIFGGGGLGVYFSIDNTDSPYAPPGGGAIIGCDTTAGAILIRPPVGMPDATKILIKHIAGANYVEFQPQGGDTFEGAAANYRIMGTNGAVAAPGAAVTVFKAGTDWKVWAEYQPTHTKVRFESASFTWQVYDLRDKALITLTAGVDTVVTLPTTMPVGRVLTIKDAGGTANAVPAPAGQKISIADAGGATFDGAASPLDITVGYSSVTLVKNSAGNWNRI